MATSIFPDIDSSGAVVFRDVDGNCLSPPEVHNIYCPPATYVATCPMTALPSDCDARIEPRQINALVSELVSFAECLDPNGPWDCNVLNNLCNAFAAWAAIYARPIHVGDTPPVNPGKNQIWWETDTGFLLIWYDDGNSQQWVQMSDPGNIVMDGVSIVGLGNVNEPYSVGLVDCGIW